MDAKKEIIARVDRDLYYHHFFDYVKDINLIDRIEAGTSLVVGFYNNDNLLFCAIFDIDADTLHVREVGGYFLKYSNALDVFSGGLAKFFNRTAVSLNTKKRAVVKMAKRLRFEHFDDLEYQKKVI